MCERQTAIQLTKAQRALVNAPTDSTLFLEGPAGSGKTTAGVERLLHLLESGVDGGSVAVLVAHRALALPYERALFRAPFASGGQPAILTFGALVAQMVELYWPLVARQAGFAQPDKPPVLLNVEGAQYIMSRIVRPLVQQQGYFEGVTVNRNRLYGELLDDLNKSAVVGFPYMEIGARLKSAWLGDSKQARVFEQVQDCATRFRAYCLEHNLLDFSLQAEVFMNHIWPVPACRHHLLGQYRHLVVDNVEEDTPAVHAILRDWLGVCDSALVIYDADAGLRTFLGADAASGYELRKVCDEAVEFTQSFVMSADVSALADTLGRVLDRPALTEPTGDPRAALAYEQHHFYPEMLNWIADEIMTLVKMEGVDPGEIVVVAPFLSDALRFSFVDRLTSAGVPARSHRPSRALRDEPATRCLLTLAELAHPDWGMTPTAYDVTYALKQSIGGLEAGRNIDLMRAQMLARDAYPDADSRSRLAPFDALPAETQERVSPILGERYDRLRNWLERSVDNPDNDGLDYFFQSLFGDVLSQTGFGFHDDFEASASADNLVTSARNFRRAFADANVIDPGKPLGREYIEMVRDGLLAAQYVGQWRALEENTVLVSPAYTFILNNLPVRYQFWLDVGSRNWAERLYQPLTHPYVLSKAWHLGDKWTDEHEYEMRRDLLYRVTQGLARRCRERIYLGLSDLSENGYDADSDLLQAIQRMMRRLNAAGRVETDV